MAENKNNRKSTRSFNLEKPVERHFDIEKEEMNVIAPDKIVNAPQKNLATLQSEQKKSEQKKPEQKKPEQKKPEQEKPEQKKTEQKKPEQKKTEQKKTDVQEEKQNGGSSKKWIAAIAGLLLVGGLAYYFTKDNKPSITDNKETAFVASDETSENQNNNVTDGTIYSTTDNSALTDEKGESGEVEEKNTTATEVTESSESQNTNKEPESISDNTSNVSDEQSAQNKPTDKSSSKNDNVSKTQQGITQPNGGKGSIEEEALKVVRGVYGNNPERRNALGANYEAIQKRVNEMYRQGLVN